MKKVAIIGANGKSGSALVVEALKQGYDVTGFARNKEYKNDAIKLVHKDVFELSKADLAGFASSSARSLHGRRRPSRFTRK